MQKLYDSLRLAKSSPQGGSLATHYRFPDRAYTAILTRSFLLCKTSDHTSRKSKGLGSFIQLCLDITMSTNKQLGKILNQFSEHELQSTLLVIRSLRAFREKRKLEDGFLSSLPVSAFVDSGSQIYFAQVKDAIKVLAEVHKKIHGTPNLSNLGESPLSALSTVSFPPKIRFKDGEDIIEGLEWIPADELEQEISKETIVIHFEDERICRLVNEKPLCYPIKRKGSKRFKIVFMLFATKTGKSASEISDKINGFASKIAQDNIKKCIRKINMNFQKKCETAAELISYDERGVKNIYFLNRERFFFKREK